MAHGFDEATLAGVLGHMNADHTGDSLLIVRAFGRPEAVSATMTGFDGDGGDWRVELADGSSAELRVLWPGGPITERPAVRREVVALHEEAVRRLG
ncbi:DUF2470 domain-containing protein [Leifsonia aquatica]|uniref:DUF2470 domain-containing protein n=1 Tax=Leifsonia aquatica TaxID=144185 RepID=UPI0028A97C00|nr:DUF2470 domain-containing protein [Leifsonia aquatica]